VNPYPCAACGGPLFSKPGTVCYWCKPDRSPAEIGRKILEGRDRHQRDETPAQTKDKFERERERLRKRKTKLTWKPR